ncbi:hypothetical protein AB0F68_30420 [Micromonospora sp. NPDC023966]|uniref:hypothetical protein n=1 Tax=Micromonospora sp. NPDC023966 TaxID=3154699 RepID=UPI0033C0C191
MSVDPDRVTIARALLDHLGLTVAGLTDTTSRAVPTVAEYLPDVVAAASPGTRRSYRSYWNRMAATLGDRRVDTVTASEIEALMRQATAGARSRRNSRHGRHAGEHFIAAARAFYSRAIADGYIAASDSPAHRVRKPRRLPNTRRALTPKELGEINRATRSGGWSLVKKWLTTSATYVPYLWYGSRYEFKVTASSLAGKSQASNIWSTRVFYASLDATCRNYYFPGPGGFPVGWTSILTNADGVAGDDNLKIDVVRKLYSNGRLWITWENRVTTSSTGRWSVRETETEAQDGEYDVFLTVYGPNGEEWRSAHDECFGVRG